MSIRTSHTTSVLKILDASVGWSMLMSFSFGLHRFLFALKLAHSGNCTSHPGGAWVLTASLVESLYPCTESPSYIICSSHLAVMAIEYLLLKLLKIYVRFMPHPYPPPPLSHNPMFWALIFSLIYPLVLFSIKCLTLVMYCINFQ